MNYPRKKDLVPGLLVEIKHDKTADVYSEGYIDEILSSGATNKAIKVKLTNGLIGRVERIIPAFEHKKNNFKFYNELLFKKSLFSIWDNELKEFYCYEPNEAISYAFIGDSKGQIEESIKKLKLSENKRYSIRALSNNSMIFNNFLKHQPKQLLINNVRKINFTRFQELESDLKEPSKNIRKGKGK